jgi:predicted dehydrogenase
MIRIGILSSAHLHAAAYVGNLRSNPAVQFIGIADEDRERGEQFAAEFNAPFIASYQSLIEQSDAVIVCSENARHFPLVKMAADARKHVLCEKPLATTLEDARAMVALCREKGVKLMTAFPMRFSTPLIEVKRTLDSGVLGRVYGCNTTNQGSCPKHVRGWFVDKELAGGGAVADHTVHVTDVLRWFFQEEVVEVYAETNHILYADEAEVETGGLIMLTFANGTFASIDCSWSKPRYYPTWGGVSLELVSEQGLVTADAFKQNITVYSHQHKRGLYNFWGSDADQAMIDEFVQAIQQDRDPAVTGEDGLRAVEVVLAAYQSADSGAPVRL